MKSEKMPTDSNLGRGILIVISRFGIVSGADERNISDERGMTRNMSTSE